MHAGYVRPPLIGTTPDGNIYFGYSYRVIGERMVLCATQEQALPGMPREGLRELRLPRVRAEPKTLGGFALPLKFHIRKHHPKFFRNFVTVQIFISNSDEVQGF